jgi:CRP-like cAMP-binding protein
MNFATATEAAKTPAVHRTISPLMTNEALSRNMKYLTENDQVLIMAKATQVKFAPGEPLIVQGFPSKALFMIRSGNTRVERDGVHLAVLNAGTVCGEMTLLEDSPASASVVALEEVTVDAVDVESMRDIFRAFPHLASRFYRSIALALSSKLRATSSRLTTLEKQATQSPVGEGRTQ